MPFVSDFRITENLKNIFKTTFLDVFALFEISIKSSQKKYGDTLEQCKAWCREPGADWGKCAGIAWAAGPVANQNNCKAQGKPRCVIYTSDQIDPG